MNFIDYERRPPPILVLLLQTKNSTYRNYHFNKLFVSRSSSNSNKLFLVLSQLSCKYLIRIDAQSFLCFVVCCISMINRQKECEIENIYTINIFDYIKTLNIILTENLYFFSYSQVLKHKFSVHFFQQKKTPSKILLS